MRNAQTATPAADASADAHYRRNFSLGVLNGVFFQFGMGFFSADVILPAFITTLAVAAGWSSGTHAIVGLGSVLPSLGWLLPQFFVARFIQPRRRKLPVYHRAVVVRSVSFILLVLCVHQLAVPLPGVLLVVSLLLLLAFGITGGVGGNAFMDIVGKTIPAGKRGSFFGTRMFFGGATGLLAGQTVRYLQARQLAFPMDYVILFSTGTLCILIGYIAFSLVKEPEEEGSTERARWREHLKRAPEILRTDRDFRMLFLTRIGGNVVALCYPFYALYAFQILGAPDTMSGTFISILAISSVLSNLLWSQIGDHYGNRRLIQWGMATSILGPLAALLVPHITPTQGFMARWLTQLGPLTSSGIPVHNLFLLAFVAVGMSRTALMMGGMNYLLDISPAAERPTYIGLMNTFSAPLMLMPMIGGYLIDWFPFQIVFLISLVAAVFTLLLAYRLTEPRKELLR